MTLTHTPSLSTQLGLPGYLLGISMLLLIMLFHGAALLQIAKRYEVKSYLYLSEKKYSAVGLTFYLGVISLFITHILEIIIWGISLWAFDLLPDLDISVLFAGSTYTAMGFMEDILPIGWKMLAIIIAFSGMFSFAWTASVMISMTKNFRQAYTRMHMHKLNLSADVIDRFK